MNKYNISERMKALADFVIEGQPVADVGTDHGFVPIDLIASEKVPFAVMTDINRGPLEKARGNLSRVGILNQYYDLRLGGGLEPLKSGEVASVIIAGMGAETIIEILSLDVEKSKSYKRLILQPRKRSWLLREWLCNNGFNITDEKLVMEEPKICEIIVASPLNEGESFECDDYYLPKALYGDPLFKKHLNEYIRKLEVVVNNMNNSDLTSDIKKSWEERLFKAERLLNEES